MTEIEWREVDADGEPDFGHPSDYECQCARQEDEYLLHITEGQMSIEHTGCGKTVEIQSIEDWSTTEPIPVKVVFVNLGMSPSTPNGPAEHNGFWWELTPRT